ncbi:hypothetical protein [Lysobacter sp. P5_B9]
MNNVGMAAGDVYKVNIRTFKADRIQRTEERVSGYVADFEGNLRARLRADIDASGAYVAAEFRDLQTGQWQEHFRSYVKNRNQVEVLGFAEDPNIAFILWAGTRRISTSTTSSRARRRRSCSNVASSMPATSSSTVTETAAAYARVKSSASATKARAAPTCSGSRRNSRPWTRGCGPR